MKTRCTLSPVDPAHAERWSPLRALIERANTRDGVSLVSDQALAEAQSGRRRSFAVQGEAQDGSVDLVGVVILADDEFDLIIDPVHRNRGFGGCALDLTLSQSKRPLRVWVHGEQPQAVALLTSRGFQPVRELLEMHHEPVPQVPVPSIPSRLPQGMRLTTFAREDAPAWVALNARVFAEHPEQGSLTLEDLDQRIGEPWFRAQDFALLWAGDELIGYCWLKIQDAHAELYVIGIAPEFSGQSLGALLLDEAMSRVRGCDRFSLFVDGDNQPARKLYETRGFTVSRISRQWLLT